MTEYKGANQSDTLKQGHTCLSAPLNLSTVHRRTVNTLTQGTFASIISFLGFPMVTTLPTGTVSPIPTSRAKVVLNSAARTSH